jgi:uncharacterized membrane protein YcaP (DUF421 family)
MADWIADGGLTGLLASAVSALGIYVALVLYTRIAGLRSFSKMSSFDFALTVAFGSVIAGTILSSDPPLLRSAVALGSLYALQFLVSRLRVGAPAVSRIVDNRPLLLMAGPEVLDDNLRRARVTREDLLAKLREANVTRWEQVRAVVMETSGDISVLHCDPDGPPLQRGLLKGVRDAGRLPETSSDS